MGPSVSAETTLYVSVLSDANKSQIIAPISFHEMKGTSTLRGHMRSDLSFILLFDTIKQHVRSVTSIFWLQHHSCPPPPAPPPQGQRMTRDTRWRFLSCSDSSFSRSCVICLFFFPPTDGNKFFFTESHGDLKSPHQQLLIYSNYRENIHRLLLTLTLSKFRIVILTSYVMVKQ